MTVHVTVAIKGKTGDVHKNEHKKASSGEPTICP
jgi:hypothetical protein